MWTIIKGLIDVFKKHSITFNFDLTTIIAYNGAIKMCFLKAIVLDKNYFTLIMVHKREFNVWIKLLLIKLTKN